MDTNCYTQGRIQRGARAAKIGHQGDPLLLLSPAYPLEVIVETLRLWHPFGTPFGNGWIRQWLDIR